MTLRLPVSAVNQPEFNRRVAQTVNALLSGGAAPAATDPAITAVSDVSTVAGMPLAISRANGHFVKADAASKPVAFVAGLAVAAGTAGFTVSLAREAMTLSDWTATTGSPSLSQGQTYFLASGGGLTTTAPASPNCLTVVGEASSPTTLLIQPQAPIQL